MSADPTYVLAIGMPSGAEWFVVLFIALLLFGRKLPEVMRNLGGSVREFKKGMETEDAKPAPPPVVAAPDGAVSRAADNPPPAPKA